MRHTNFNQDKHLLDSLIEISKTGNLCRSCHVNSDGRSEKMRLYRIGSKHSEETKEKMRLAWIDRRSGK